MKIDSLNIELIYNLSGDKYDLSSQDLDFSKALKDMEETSFKEDLNSALSEINLKKEFKFDIDKYFDNWPPNQSLLIQEMGDGVLVTVLDSNGGVLHISYVIPGIDLIKYPDKAFQAIIHHILEIGFKESKAILKKIRQLGFSNLLLS